MKFLKIRRITLGDGVPKVAVPLMAENKEGCFQDAQEAVRAGADILELRADVLLPELCEPKEMTELLHGLRERAGDVPLLFTFRTSSEGGKCAVDDPEYERIVRNALASGKVDMVDIEQERSVSTALLHYAHSISAAVILSFHDFHHTPDVTEIVDRMKKMKASGADVAKIAVMPENETDPTRILLASAWANRYLDLPFVLISMGEKGQKTRLSAAYYGSVFSFGALPGRISAPGQMNARELKSKLEEIKSRNQTGRCIFLTGFMGSGKTTVGQVLSEKSGLPFSDLDRMIEKRAGCSIPTLFETKGQVYFRDLESDEIAGLYDVSPAIVSCGGGAVLRPENVDLMRCLGKIVLLGVRPETVFSRLADEAANRPNLRGRMTIDGIRELMEQRRPRYEEAADFTVETDGRTPDQIAEEILGTPGLFI